MKKCLFAVLSLSFLSASAFAGGLTTDYTPLKGKTCKTKKLGDENGGYFTTHCKGMAGYSVILDEGDSRSSLRFKRSGSAPMDVEGGLITDKQLSFIYVAGTKVEWRSTVEHGKKTPVAIIYRVAGQDDSDADVKNWKDIQFLQVAKITPNQICVIASVLADGNENATARQIADEKAATFVCPKQN